MPMRLGVRQQAAGLLLAALPLFGAGCGYDRQARIIDATLHRPDGSVDSKALGGALGGKFFDKPPQDLAALVESWGGSCDKPDESGFRMKCRVPLSGASCVADQLSLDVFLVKGQVGAVAARIEQLTC